MPTGAHRQPGAAVPPRCNRVKAGEGWAWVSWHSPATSPMSAACTPDVCGPLCCRPTYQARPPAIIRSRPRGPARWQSIAANSSRIDPTASSMTAIRVGSISRRRNISRPSSSSAHGTPRRRIRRSGRGCDASRRPVRAIGRTRAGAQRRPEAEDPPRCDSRSVRRPRRRLVEHYEARCDVGVGCVKLTRPAVRTFPTGARGTAWPVRGTLSLTVTRPVHAGLLNRPGPQPPPGVGPLRKPSPSSRRRGSSLLSRVPDPPATAVIGMVGLVRIVRTGSWGEAPCLPIWMCTIFPA